MVMPTRAADDFPAIRARLVELRRPPEVRPPAPTLDFAEFERRLYEKMRKAMEIPPWYFARRR